MILLEGVSTQQGTPGDMPTFIVIGAMKCGTTSLYQYLNWHPEVSMSEVKETDFFLECNEYDVTWYRSLFKGKTKARGEVSPNYTKYPSLPGVPERMHSLLPGAKLIYLVRDPIDRIVSHFTHNEAHGREMRSFDEVFSGELEQNHYVICSRYFMQLEQYLKFYSEEQILVLQSEQLRINRHRTLRRIFEFVHVDPTFHVPEHEGEAHNSSHKRVATPAVRRIQRTARKSRFVQEVMDVLPEGLTDYLQSGYRRFFKKPAVRPNVPKLIEEQLIDHLREDADALREYTGMTFSEWRL